MPYLSALRDVFTTRRYTNPRLPLQQQQQLLLLLLLHDLMPVITMQRYTCTERPVTGRMDYIVWHQDLVTSAPVSDLEVFQVPDEGLFLAAAALDQREPRRKQQSTLFKWNKDHFTVYQSIYTLGAYCWEHFVIGKRVNDGSYCVSRRILLAS